MSEQLRRRLVVAAVLAVVAGVIAVGWLTRDPAPAPVSAGEQAPPLRLPLVDGDTVDLAELRGRVVLVNVWATWCAPCLVELPAMQRTYEALAPRGFEIVAVAVDARPGERQADGRVVGVVSEFADQLGLTFPVALDPTGGTERALGVRALPTTFLVDRQGRIRIREVGGRYWDTEPYRGMIESLLGEDRV